MTAAAAVPSAAALAALAGAIVHLISRLGYAGIAALMAIESACIPLPSEITLPFAGFLASTGRFSLPLIALVGALGCNLGSEVAYLIGARGGRSLVLRHGRWLLLRPDDLGRAERWFARRGEVTVFVARLLPVLRTFIALPAGVARMSRWRFHLYTFLGSLPWCWALAYFGLRLGERWDTLKVYFERLDGVILAGLVVLLALFLWRHWPRAKAVGGTSVESSE